ncbi:hypothetical protein CDL60_24695 [Roseateles noduli]|nr:hypothetical protein CDL60_24695 [Roseateles noduli]
MLLMTLPSRSRLLIGLLLSVLGVLLSLVSAPSYGKRFIAASACAVGSFLFLINVAGLGRTWRGMRIFFCLLAAYTLADVLLRAFFSSRVLNVLNLFQ